MNIQPDDPKWTAYVLGELSDSERLEVERELETFPEARAIVDEIRMMSALLTNGLAEETPAALLPEQRKWVREAVPSNKWWNQRLVWGLAAAALVVLAIALPPVLQKPQQIAAIPTPPSQEPATVIPRIDPVVPSPPTAKPPKQDRPAAQPALTKEVDKKADTDSLNKYLDDLKNSQSGTLTAGQMVDGFANGTPPPLNELKQFKSLPTAETGTPAASAAGGVGGGGGVKGGVMGGVLSGALRSAPEAAAAAPMSAGNGGGGGGGRGGARPMTTYPVLRPNGFNRAPYNTESYDHIEDNPFKMVADDPVATFSIDVDTASYANMRRFLTQNQLPPKDSVRIEELINYFNYDYPQPSGRNPIAVQAEVAAAPWRPDHRLVKIGIKAKDINMNQRPPTNLVFLIDVSGSMMPPERLPLLKSSLKLLVERLTENDRVAIVVYAGNSGLVLPSTTGDHQDVIIRTLDRLEAGGSTNGASGIQLAYQTAVANFVRGGINRVILCTDGDFNVGVTNQGDLTRMIEDEAKSGVFLSVLGVGQGNLKDSTMEKLADKGNGNYAYIDSLNEGRKVLLEQMGGTLMTVAKDVKIQVDFNPAQVEAYRLIGYENRILQNQDFNNDAKDAGDMGAGQTVTALFEVVPRGGDVGIPGVDPSKYGPPQPKVTKPAANSSSNELFTVRVRYKQPDATDSTRFDVPVVNRGVPSFDSASSDFRFAAAVAEFGMILRDSPYRGQASLDHVISVADRSRGVDRNGYREEFVGLAVKARALMGRRD